jgi:uncharacterized protein YdaU (DUF1376 family)
MNPPPAFQVYAKDFRSDPVVRRMTLAEIGLLLVLWTASWESESQGTLPADPWLISKITGRDVRNIRKFLAKFPEIYSESAGKLHIKKLCQQSEELQQRRQNQSAAAEATNRKRWPKPPNSDSVNGRSPPASASPSANSRCSLMRFSQDHDRSEEQEGVPSISKLNAAFKKAGIRMDMQATKDPQRTHLEVGIYRKKVGGAYFDATNAAMGPDECIQEALREGARSMLGNRGAELPGLNEGELASRAWERIRMSVAALQAIQNFETRRQHVVAVCTRVVTDLAYEFWQRQVINTQAAE